MKTRFISICLAVILLVSMCSCSFVRENNDPEPETTMINVYTLNGTTGFGMAKMMSDTKVGNGACNYTFSVQTDAANVTAALLNGSADIAALPTNAAANVYNIPRQLNIPWSCAVTTKNTAGRIWWLI